MEPASSRLVFLYVCVIESRKVRVCGRRMGAATGGSAHPSATLVWQTPNECGQGRADAWLANSACFRQDRVRVMIGAWMAALVVKPVDALRLVQGRFRWFCAPVCSCGFDADGLIEKVRCGLGPGPISMRWSARRRRIRFEGLPDGSGSPSNLGVCLIAGPANG